MWQNLLSSPDYVDWTLLLQKLAAGPSVAEGLLCMAWDAYAFTLWDGARPHEINARRKKTKESFHDDKKNHYRSPQRILARNVIKTQYLQIY